MKEREIALDLEKTSAKIINHTYRNAAVKTLAISFADEREILSTREGFKSVKAVCNCYVPPSLWDFMHKSSDVYSAEVAGMLGLNTDVVGLLFTGVDMDYVTLRKEEFEDFKVYAFVTAGVKSNALRIGTDKATRLERNGKFERLGTINTIILSNASFSHGAMARSIITATEAKIIALQDLDVRSSYTPAENQASGTGTDNIIVVSGKGPVVGYAGGHTKMGELIATAVTSATKKALITSGDAVGVS